MLLFQRCWDQVIDRCNRIFTATLFDIALDRWTDAFRLLLRLFLVNQFVSERAMIAVFLLLQEEQVEKADLLVLIDVGENLPQPLQESRERV